MVLENQYKITKRKLACTIQCYVKEAKVLFKKRLARIKWQKSLLNASAQFRILLKQEPFDNGIEIQLWVLKE